MWEKFRSSNPDKGVRIRQLLNPIRSIPKTTMTTTMGTMLLSFNDRRVAPCCASCRDTNKPVPIRDHNGAIRRRRHARNVIRLKRRHAVMTTHHENHGELILRNKNNRKPRRHQPNKGSKQASKREEESVAALFRATQVLPILIQHYEVGDSDWKTMDNNQRA